MHPGPNQKNEDLLAELKVLQEKYNDLFRLYNINLEDLRDLKELLELANHRQSIKQAELNIARKEIALQTREKELREEATKDLEAFSYSVSHDLRAPLRHVNGFIDLLLKNFYDQLPDKARHYLDNIADAARQMDLLINDLLEFARTGKKEVQKVRVDMNAMVRDIVAQHNGNNTKRSIEWQVSDLPPVKCDEAMMHQVWLNLIENAVKFTRRREKTIIKIQAIEKDQEFVFSINDNGAGFDVKYAQNLFGVFQRLHSSGDFEGTGIGLANVKSIVLKHKGLIWAEAEPDKGATFYFSLPKMTENEL